VGIGDVEAQLLRRAVRLVVVQPGREALLGLAHEDRDDLAIGDLLDHRPYPMTNTWGSAASAARRSSGRDSM
jgi:hypothetical protein